jgi:formylglycine-generating enzyme required for sulfatase activity
MAKALKDVGFEVLSGVNQNKRQMETLIREFGAKLANSGGVGLFYYAGHGVQVSGVNYLVPIDAEIPEEDEVQYQAVSLDLVLTKMTTAKNDLNLVILDACRNNPFARSWRTFRDGGNNDGLAKISPPTGTLVLYATEPGKVASDGAGRNGLFTEALLKQIKTPNLEYDQMVKAVSAEVWQKSNKAQLPWKEGNSLSDFYFMRKDSPVVEAVKNNQTETTIVAKTKVEQEKEAWDLVKNSSDAEDFRFYLKEFPNGANAEKAKIRLEELAWLALRNSNDKAKVQAYLNEFPNGANASAARIKLRQMETATTTQNNPTTTTNQSTEDSLAELEAWNKIKNSTNPADFQAFLKTYPSGAFATQARAKISNITDAEWTRLKTSKNPNDYKTYLAANPNGRFTEEARTRMNMLVQSMVAFEQIRDSKDVEDFKAYVAKYPEGAFVEEARGMFEAPKVGVMRRNSFGMEFMYIPAGNFMMGSNEGGDEKAHRVTLSQPFWMGRTEVTQAQWQAVMGNNPSYFKNCPQCPVETVSWEDAQRFVDKLNAQNDGFKYRLPTEAEWEYAARSGTTGDYAGNLDSMAWYSGNSGNKTHEVATKQPNAWGLYDMHGNVWEWCEDWYGDYPSGAVTNPTGAASGSYRVFRGGSWYFDAVNLRSAYRNRNSPSLRLSRLGFRVVRY